ncbi:phosphatase PAP2 family protein [Roseateles oligotrophus]|uniref:Phosphatase PAP2 family protein n=1 Tax=Roseateles oligotrophus TaxID=1769250 RepID=A0ABT2YCX0_9BURK|nr:phosphatase PAP2 family protein [Roseateles oligotrophus]MCV2367888.1 phosphatase PAP2 family protein [Roseateles oligotrophus]
MLSISAPLVTATPFWQLLTRLGEIQILLPLALLCSLCLWRQSVVNHMPAQAQLARRWMLSFGAAIGLTAASKLAFFAWGWGIAAWDFTGISGHAMVSAAVLPLLAGYALMGQSPPLRRLGVIFGFGLAALIAYSRLKVGAHSPAESLAGFVLGGLASLFSLELLPRAQSAKAPPIYLPVGLLAALLLMPFGAPKSRSHDWVIQLSLQLSGRSQPFVRADLHRQQMAPFSARSMRRSTPESRAATGPGQAPR